MRVLSRIADSILAGWVVSTGVTSTPSRVRVSRGVIGIADDEMIALAQMRQHHCRARGHAGSKGYAGFGLLEDGEFLFELPGGRVVPAGVDKRSFRGQVVRRETDFLVDHESARHFQAGSRCTRGRIRIFAAVD
jgi:hypothetical protein